MPARVSRAKSMARRRAPTTLGTSGGGRAAPELAGFAPAYTTATDGGQSALIARVVRQDIAASRRTHVMTQYWCTSFGLGAIAARADPARRGSTSRRPPAAWLFNTRVAHQINVALRPNNSVPAASMPLADGAFAVHLAIEVVVSSLKAGTPGCDDGVLPPVAASHHYGSWNFMMDCSLQK
jgi:hypothetical protein